MAMTMVVVKTSQLDSTNYLNLTVNPGCLPNIHSLPYGEPQSSPKWAIDYIVGSTCTPRVSAASESDFLQRLTLTQQAGM